MAHRTIYFGVQCIKLIQCLYLDDCLVIYLCINIRCSTCINTRWAKNTGAEGYLKDVPLCG
jgi:hypothetical protein